MSGYVTVEFEGDDGIREEVSLQRDESQWAFEGLPVKRMDLANALNIAPSGMWAVREGSWWHIHCSSMGWRYRARVRD